VDGEWTCVGRILRRSAPLAAQHGANGLCSAAVAKFWRHVFPWLVSIALLVYVFQATDWASLRASMVDANVPLFLLFTTLDRVAYFIVWTTITVAAMRRFVRDVPSPSVFAIRGGAELFRTVSNPLADGLTLVGLGQIAGGRVDVVLAAALVPAVCHLFVLLLQVTLALFLLEGGAAANRDVASAAVFVWGVMLSGFVAVRLSQTGRIRGMKRVREFLDRFPLRTIAPFVVAFIGVTSFDVLIQGLATRAFGAPIGWLDLMARIPLLYLALVVPSLGNFGTRELAWAALFEGVADRDALIAFAFATNAVFLVLNLVLGLVFLPRALTLLRELRRQRKAGESVREPLLHDPVDL